MGDALLTGDFEYVEFECDSLDALDNLQGSSTNANWPIFRLARPLANIAAVKIIEAQIPVSYYVFNSNNNKFTIYIGGVNPYTVTIPVGNYTSATIGGVLQTALTTAYSSATWTVTLLNNKITITCSLTFNATFPSNTNLHYYLGFAAGSSGTAATTLAAPYFYNLSGPNYIYLNSSKIGAACNCYLPNSQVSSGNFSACLAKIPITSNTGGVSYYIDPAPEKWFNVENLYNISDIDFYCTLANTNEIIDFNGLGFSLKLGLIIKSDTHTQNLAGTMLQNRVSKRVRPN